MGGGYAGLTCARKLVRKGLDVTVVNPHGYMTYQPLLPETAAGTVQPAHVVVPLRSALPQARILTASLTALDIETRVATATGPDGTVHRLRYDDLVLAVYGVQIDALDQRSRELSTSDDPGAALREWMRGFVAFYAVKQGMVTLLRAMMNDGRSEHFEHTRETLRLAAERMLAPAIEAGVVRGDVAAADLLRALGGICLTSEPRGVSPESTLALVDLVYDGLRFGATASASA